MGRSYWAVPIEPFLRQPLFPFSLSGTAASCVKSDPSASCSDKQQLLRPNAATLIYPAFSFDLEVQGMQAGDFQI
jgi:hypothetical protein